MSPEIFYCEQLSRDWWELRRAIPTASGFDRILTPKTMKASTQQDDYIAELISERSEFVPPYISPSGGFVSDEMSEGIRREPEARSWYGLQTDGNVKQVGFVLSADKRAGCSPDALIDDDGVLELKNPTRKVHVKYLLGEELPSEYKCQVHGALIVTQRKWVDFVSYCPGLPAFLVRVEPDEFTDKLRKELDAFCDRYQQTLARVSKM